MSGKNMSVGTIDKWIKYITKMGEGPWTMKIKPESWRLLSILCTESLMIAKE